MGILCMHTGSLSPSGMPLGLNRRQNRSLLHWGMVRFKWVIGYPLGFSYNSGILPACLPSTTTTMPRESVTHCGVRDSSLLADCQLRELLLWGFVLVGLPQVKSKVQVSNWPQLLLETFPSTGLLPRGDDSSILSTPYLLQVIFCLATVNGKIIHLTTSLRSGVTAWLGPYFLHSLKVQWKGNLMLSSFSEVTHSRW